MVLKSDAENNETYGMTIQEWKDIRNQQLQQIPFSGLEK